MNDIDLYLDANATTPVLPAARMAALAAMAEDFGNPSSSHGTGLKARALMNTVRARARRVLGADSGQLLFLSGATEGIQTAVFSALVALRERRMRGQTVPPLLLYGATEHKAVPEAIHHWNTLLGLCLQVLAIPVDAQGLHDLAWLRAQAPRAGLVCTMAANNETGVISNLPGIADALTGSPALWLVDSVQALGKLPLRLTELPIDYAPFSGHKLYAPKGIGLLYVREQAPLTPLMAGGGQEGALRSGTENMPGIAALGAVLEALEDGRLIRSPEVLTNYRDQLAHALSAAFPGLVFNAPAHNSLPTTLNFSVKGLESRLLLDLFDAAEMRVSGGSACSAAKAQPSHVLEAMGLPSWQTASAVRLSFGPGAGQELIAEACQRIRACGEALRDSCLTPVPPVDIGTSAPDRLTRFVLDGVCSYLVADASSQTCVVIDPVAGLTTRLVQWIRCRGYSLRALLRTGGDDEPGDDLADLQSLLDPMARGAADPLGWPLQGDTLSMGALRLTKLSLSPSTADRGAYLLTDAAGLCVAFIGAADAPRAADENHAEPPSTEHLVLPLESLRKVIAPDTLLLPGHDEENRFALTLAEGLDLVTHAQGRSRREPGAPAEQASVEIRPEALAATAAGHSAVILVDVREPYEQRLGSAPDTPFPVRRMTVPLSALPNALPEWQALGPDTLLLFYCRTGNRSAQAATVLRRLSRAKAYSVAGGLALWPSAALATQIGSDEQRSPA